MICEIRGCRAPSHWYITTEQGVVPTCEAHSMVALRNGISVAGDEGEPVVLDDNGEIARG